MPESVGSGVAFIDYNNDGYQDIFFVNSRDWTDAEIRDYQHGKWNDVEIETFKNKNGRDAYRAGMLRIIPKRKPEGHSTGVLYHNNGNGTFTDVTRNSGLDVEIYGMGAAVGDYDNDGKADLYVTGLTRNYLFRNRSSKDQARFDEVAKAANVQDSGWSTSAMWVDYDKDGWLDLFVCHYIHWTPGTEIFETNTGLNKSYTAPRYHRARANKLFRNRGDGQFADVSLKAGIQLPPAAQAAAFKRDQDLEGKALGIALADINKDSFPDLVVANDAKRNYLFLSTGKGTFTEGGTAAGIAFDARGNKRGGMGIDVADIDHTDNESIAIGFFSKQMLGLYHNQGQGTFLDIAAIGQVGRDSLNFLTFGLVFADLDNDTWPDILTANGHIADDIHQTSGTFGSGVTYAQRPLLFRNLGELRFEEIGLRSGKALSKPMVARGLASADIDLDGDSDVVFTAKNSAPLLLRNDSENKNNVIRVELRGSTSNRSAIGAVVRAKLQNTGLRRTVRSGSSYLSQSELPLTFGLGKENEAELLSVRWPSGTISKYPNVQANQLLVIDERRGIVSRRPLARSVDH
jgi:hypothetical protein